MSIIFKKLLVVISITIVFIDLFYSFYQFKLSPLDGDMAGGIVQDEKGLLIFNDPYGIKVVSQNVKVENPNRYYSHLAFRSYFRNVPFLVQKFTNPIDSIYVSAAIAKIVIQFIFILVLTVSVIKILGVFDIMYLTIPILIIPFFQTNGAVETIGIIDPSITYNFFYSLPLLFFLIYVILFFWVLNNFHNKYKNIVIGILLILVLTIPFSGPLIAPLMAIFSMLILMLRLLKYEIFKSDVFKGNDIKNYVLIFCFTSLLISLYSIYLGTYNSIGSYSDISLSNQYNRLFIGIYHYFFERDELQALVMITFLNTIIIRQFFYDNFGKKIISFYLLFWIFTIIYILLLPFGGYREYRPYILRYDILMPLTVGLILFFTLSVAYIIKNSTIDWLKFSFIFIVFYYLIDLHKKDVINFQSNECEIEALEELAKSTSTKVEIVSDCNVLSWGRITKYEESNYIGKVLFFWNITKKELTFIHSKEEKD